MVTRFTHYIALLSSSELGYDALAKLESSFSSSHPAKALVKLGRWRREDHFDLEDTNSHLTNIYTELLEGIHVLCCFAKWEAQKLLVEDGIGKIIIEELTSDRGLTEEIEVQLIDIIVKIGKTCTLLPTLASQIKTPKLMNELLQLVVG